MIPSNDLLRQYTMYKHEYDSKAIEVLQSGYYILGKEVTAFEAEFAAYVGAPHCAGVASGLDALTIALKCLNVEFGDEVILPSNTYIATVLAVSACGATPIFAEPDEYYNIDTKLIGKLITPRTKVILSVNLYGQSCDMKSLRAVCDENDLFLVEDCAQSHGSLFEEKPTPYFSDISCYSFYPSKNLGAFSDAGALVSGDEELIKKAKVIRNYGSEKRYHNEMIGMNSRLSEMQAGLLRVKLSHIDELTAQRASLAGRYLKEINNPLITLPSVRENATDVHHLFVVRTERRDDFVGYMQERDIHILIHYPIPPHLSGAYAHLGYSTGAFPIAEHYANTVATLPLFNGMTENEQTVVINAANDWR